jgi:hypothetical protein
MDLREYPSGKRPTLGDVSEFPSIQFGVEMAFQSLAAKSPFLLFPSEFTEVKIHPNQWLVWMEGGIYEGTEEKLKQGFHCIKLKIGAIDFDKTIIELYSETFRSRKNGN